MPTVSVYVSQDCRDWIEAEAESRGLRISAVIRELIEERAKDAPGGGKPAGPRRWLPLELFPAYEISNDGLVVREISSRLEMIKDNKQRVSLLVDNEVRRVRVRYLIPVEEIWRRLPTNNRLSISSHGSCHDLDADLFRPATAAEVALCYLPPPRRDRTWLKHINGDESDCRAVNLVWAPPKKLKLSEDERKEIVQRHRCGESDESLMRAFNQTRTTIARIIWAGTHKEAGEDFGKVLELLERDEVHRPDPERELWHDYRRGAQPEALAKKYRLTLKETNDIIWKFDMPACARLMGQLEG